MESFRPPFSKGGRFQRQSLWPPIAMGGTLLFAPRARTKRKKRSHELMYQFMTCRPAADDPAPSFWLQNDGLEFSKLYPRLICVSKPHPFVQFARPYSLFRQADAFPFLGRRFYASAGQSARRIFSSGTNSRPYITRARFSRSSSSQSCAPVFASMVRR